MKEIRLNKDEYISVDESGKIAIQYKDKFVEFENLRDMIGCIQPGAFRLTEVKGKLAEMKFENNERKLYLAYWYEYECLNNYVVIVARNKEEAKLLFDKYLIENCDNVSIEWPYEITSEHDIYEELLEEYGSKEVGAYEW